MGETSDGVPVGSSVKDKRKGASDHVFQWWSPGLPERQCAVMEGWAWGSEPDPCPSPGLGQPEDLDRPLVLGLRLVCVNRGNDTCFTGLWQVRGHDRSTLKTELSARLKHG